MAAEVVLRLAEAVEHAHGRGVLHRDLKPSNVMLEGAAEASSGEFPLVPRLTDFGLAGLLEPVMAETRSSVVLGTPLYMAPEQLKSSESPRVETDVYGLGMILYELLTLKTPHEANGVAELFDVIRGEDAVSPEKHNPRVPRDLAMICLKCLRKDPGDRYRTPGELADDLGRYLAGEAVEACPLPRRVRFARWARRPSGCARRVS